MKSYLSLSLILLLLSACQQSSTVMPTKHKQETNAKARKEILLIGTFHFHNPGADVVKTNSFDILSESAQAELEEITNKIKEFKPTKLFVEQEIGEQTELQDWYKRFQQPNYFDGELSNYERKNEVAQLAFRAAHKLNMSADQVIGIDFQNTEFPIDSVLQVMQEHQQTELLTSFQDMIAKFTAEFNEQLVSGISLKELMYSLNTPHSRQVSNELYTDLILKAGDQSNTIGAYLVSEWYKRNLYTWGAVQKGIEEQDERVVLLMGASHIALIEQFLKGSTTWKTVELVDIMK